MCSSIARKGRRIEGREEGQKRRERGGREGRKKGGREGGRVGEEGRKRERRNMEIMNTFLLLCLSRL